MGMFGYSNTVQLYSKRLKTTPDAIIGIGWLSGIAAQLSLPNIFSPPSAAIRSDEAARSAGQVRAAVSA